MAGSWRRRHPPCAMRCAGWVPRAGRTSPGDRTAFGPCACPPGSRAGSPRRWPPGGRGTASRVPLEIYANWIFGEETAAMKRIEEVFELFPHHGEDIRPA